MEDRSSRQPFSDSRKPKTERQIDMFVKVIYLKKVEEGCFVPEAITVYDCHSYTKEYSHDAKGHPEALRMRLTRENKLLADMNFIKRNPVNIFIENDYGRTVGHIDFPTR